MIFKNKDIHLDELSLNVKIVGDILPNRNNDLEYNWTFIGKNSSQEDVGKFYLRMGGDSASFFSNLKVKCVDCAIDISNCEKRDHIYACPIKDDCLKKHTPYFIKNDTYSSKTLYLLEVNLIEKIKPLGNLRLKISYIWPQCFNSACDFILIDPNNFAESVGRIRITITSDELIIKVSSKIQLFSINRNNNRIENEGQVILLADGISFERVFEVEKNRIYFVTIEN